MTRNTFLSGIAIVLSLAAAPAYSQNRAKAGDPPPTGGEVMLLVSPSRSAASLADLVNQSDLIVEGEVSEILASRRFGAPGPAGTVVTDHRIRITRTFHSQWPDLTEIMLVQHGGVIDNTRYNAIELLPLEVKSKVFLFLVPDNEPREPKSAPKHFYAVGVWAGVILADGDNLKAAQNIRPHLKTELSQGRPALIDALTKLVRNFKQ